MQRNDKTCQNKKSLSKIKNKDKCYVYELPIYHIEEFKKFIKAQTLLDGIYQLYFMAPHYTFQVQHVQSYGKRSTVLKRRTIQVLQSYSYEVMGLMKQTAQF